MRVSNHGMLMGTKVRRGKRHRRSEGAQSNQETFLALFGRRVLIIPIIQITENCPIAAVKVITYTSI
jgi:hypothetical protein